MLGHIARHLCLLHLLMFRTAEASTKFFEKMETPAGETLDDSYLTAERTFQISGSVKILCASFCSQDATCTTFTADEGAKICSLYVVAIPVALAESPPVQYYLSRKVLLLRHDLAAGGLFPVFAGSWSLNKEDPQAPLYSRMDELELFLGDDGVYNFKLCYPEIASGDDGCFVFDQQSDPRTTADPSGFVPISHPAGYPFSDCQGNANIELKGLNANRPDKTWVRGVGSSTSWHHAVGASSESAVGGTFPGPYCVAGGENGFTVTAVELYVINK